jgi:hypothetical protein
MGFQFEDANGQLHSWTPALAKKVSAGLAEAGVPLTEDQVADLMGRATASHALEQATHLTSRLQRLQPISATQLEGEVDMITSLNVLRLPSRAQGLTLAQGVLMMVIAAGLTAGGFYAYGRWQRAQSALTDHPAD